MSTTPSPSDPIAGDSSPESNPAPAAPTRAKARKAKKAGKAGGRAHRRHLSVVRILVALVVVTVTIGAATHVTIGALQKQAASTKQWFAPYVDVTLPPSLDFQDPTVNPSPDVVLAFIVGGQDSACEPTWGGQYSLDQAATQLDLDRRIARYREQGGDVLVSFGGEANSELALSCTDPAKLTAAYLAVVNRYHLSAIDLDLEGSGLDPAASLRRATAIAAVQAAEHKAGHDLAVWLTLPVAVDGLQPNAVSTLDDMLAAKVNVAGVNIMTMDYGSDRPAGTSIVEAAMQSVDATERQLVSAYRRVGTLITPVEAYARIGVTPMIGQNDEPTDVLTTADAQRLFDDATNRGVSRFSMWSLNRDVECGGNVVSTIANDRCSGVPEKLLQFSNIFNQVGGRATPTGPALALGGRAPVVSDAENGPFPYPEWRPRREYDMGTETTWRGEVYEAKWWNVAAQPDAQVAHSWDSPWRDLGPVLAEDASLDTTTTIPVGIYPQWHPTKVYYPGDRVEQYGVGYRAKWWTEGDDPSADPDNTWQTPWEEVPGVGVKPPTTTTTVPKAVTTTKLVVPPTTTVPATTTTTGG